MSSSSTFLYFNKVAVEEEWYFFFPSYRFMVIATRIRPLQERSMRFLKYPGKFHIFRPFCHIVLAKCKEENLSPICTVADVSAVEDLS